MEQSKPFGLLLQSVVGYSQENVVCYDQVATYDQKLLVEKGSLVTVLSQREAKATVGHFKPLHNYKYVEDHRTVTLYCETTQVYPLTKNQRALLNGVVRKSVRIEVLHNLDWVERLKEGQYVYVTIPTIPVPVKGVVRLIGPLKGEVGTKFGIELQVATCIAVVKDVATICMSMHKAIHGL